MLDRYLASQHPFRGVIVVAGLASGARLRSKDRPARFGQSALERATQAPDEAQGCPKARPTRLTG